MLNLSIFKRVEIETLLINGITLHVLLSKIAILQIFHCYLPCRNSSNTSSYIVFYKQYLIRTNNNFNFPLVCNFVFSLITIFKFSQTHHFHTPPHSTFHLYKYSIFLPHQHKHFHTRRNNNTFFPFLPKQNFSCLSTGLHHLSFSLEYDFHLFHYIHFHPH